MRCRSVACGTAGRMQSVTQSATRLHVTHPTGVTARIAHHFAEVQSVVVCDLPPAFAASKLAYDGVKALPGRIGQQMRFFQSTPAKPGQRSLCLQRRNGDSGLSRNSPQVRRARSDSAEQEKQYR